jgi:ribonuclease P protein component
VIPSAHRLTHSSEYSDVVRRGVRAGRSTVVVHLLMGADEPALTRFGFVVSKAVGNAVTRNLVKRRLRAITGGLLADGAHERMRAVIRALPPAAAAPFGDLAHDVAGAFAQAKRRSAVTV